MHFPSDSLLLQSKADVDDQWSRFITSSDRMAAFTSSALFLEQVLELFDIDKSKTVKRIYKPKGGEVYIYDTEGGKTVSYNFYSLLLLASS
jgi:hypothetical protein